MMGTLLELNLVRMLSIGEEASEVHETTGLNLANWFRSSSFT